MESSNSQVSIDTGAKRHCRPPDRLILAPNDRTISQVSDGFDSDKSSMKLLIGSNLSRYFRSLSAINQVLEKFRWTANSVSTKYSHGKSEKHNTTKSAISKPSIYERFDNTKECALCYSEYASYASNFEECDIVSEAVEFNAFHLMEPKPPIDKSSVLDEQRRGENLGDFLSINGLIGQSVGWLSSSGFLHRRD